MSVPNTLYNSTFYEKYIVDAIPLNENFESLADGTAINNGVVLPRHIAQTTDAIYAFPAQIELGAISGYPDNMQPGSIYYCVYPDGSTGFVGVCLDSEGNKEYTAL